MKQPPKQKDVGPDPVWGVGLFILGFFVMGIGGAGNWHWTFNIGEGVMLFGAGVFLVCVAITSNKRDPVLPRLKRAFRGEVEKETE